MRRVFRIVRGQVGEQSLDDADRVGVVLGEEMDVAGDGGVHVGAADLLHRHHLAGHRLDHFGPGDEHVGVVAGHHDEIHQRRRIGRPARAGTAYDGDLRDDARQQDVHVKDGAVAGERVDALLDARAGRVLERDDRGAELGGLLHQRHDLVRVHLAERAADDGEILAEGRDLSTADIAGAGHDPVGGQRLLLHAEEAAGMLDVGAELLKRGFLKQRVEPVARRHQPLVAAPRELVGAASGENLLPAPAQILELFHRKRHPVTVRIDLDLSSGAKAAEGSRLGDRFHRFREWDQCRPRGPSRPRFPL